MKLEIEELYLMLSRLGDKVTQIATGKKLGQKKQLPSVLASGRWIAAKVGFPRCISNFIQRQSLAHRGAAFLRRYMQTFVYQGKKKGRDVWLLALVETFAGSISWVHYICNRCNSSLIILQCSSLPEVLLDQLLSRRPQLFRFLNLLEFAEHTCA